MAKKQAYLIVGLPHCGVPALTAALEEHRDVLADHGVRVPAKSTDETFRAAVELRREHRAWGLRRKDVEGTWAAICRRLHKHAEPAVLGHELLAGAGPREIALLVDGLRGRDLHVVVLAGAPDARVAVLPDELDLESVLTRWSGAVASPDHLHVVVGGARAAWTTLAGLLGVDVPALTDATPTAGGPVDAAGLRLVAEGEALEHEELVELAEHWAKVVADAGYDLTGDLRALRPGPAAQDPTREVLQESLLEAVTEIGRLRERIHELEQGRRKRSVRLPGVLVGGA